MNMNNVINRESTNIEISQLITKNETDSNKQNPQNPIQITPQELNDAKDTASSKLYQLGILCASPGLQENSLNTEMKNNLNKSILIKEKQKRMISKLTPDNSNKNVYDNDSNINSNQDKILQSNFRINKDYKNDSSSQNIKRNLNNLINKPKGSLKRRKIPPPLNLSSSTSSSCSSRLNSSNMKEFPNINSTETYIPSSAPPHLCQFNKNQTSIYNQDYIKQSQLIDDNNNAKENGNLITNNPYMFYNQAINDPYMNMNMDMGNPYVFTYPPFGGTPIPLPPPPPPPLSHHMPYFIYPYPSVPLYSPPMQNQQLNPNMIPSDNNNNNNNDDFEESDRIISGNIKIQDNLFTFEFPNELERNKDMFMSVCSKIWDEFEKIK